MSARVESLNRIEENHEDESKHFTLENELSDNDSTGQELHSEGSNADIFQHPDEEHGGDAKKPLHARHQQNCLEECQTPNESEIIFLKLKLKLLVKESHEEYRKVWM